MLYKKGDREDAGSYRAISLLCILSGVVARVAAARLSQWADIENMLPSCQWGFRKGRSTRDVIMLLRMILEQYAAAEERLALMINKRAAAAKK